MSTLSPSRLRRWQRGLTSDGMGGFTEGWTLTTTYVRAYITRPTPADIEAAHRKQVKIEAVAFIIPGTRQQIAVGDRFRDSDGRDWEVTDIIKRTNVTKVGLLSVSG